MKLFALIKFAEGNGNMQSLFLRGRRCPTVLPATFNSSFYLLFALEDAVAQSFVDKRGIHQGCDD
jgi:hypothetical protein